LGLEIGLRLIYRAKDVLRVGSEQASCVGQPDPAADPFEQDHTGLPLQSRELLRDGRGRESEGPCDGGDRPSRFELTQDPKPAKIDHPDELTN
jgi:hypothetical protein